MTPRPATQADIPALRQLHLANWRSAYADMMPTEALAAPADACMDAKWGADALDQRRVLVCEDGGAAAGFVAFCEDEDGAIFLDNLHITEKARGRGIARILTRQVATCADTRPVWLYVPAANPALDIYLGWGGAATAPFETTFLGTTVTERRVTWPSGHALAQALIP